MGAKREVVLTCDQAGCHDQARIEETRVARARKVANQRGWLTQPDLRDYCPQHNPRRFE